jgi:hypothetical protein
MLLVDRWADRALVKVHATAGPCAAYRPRGQDGGSQMDLVATEHLNLHAALERQLCRAGHVDVVVLLAPLDQQGSARQVHLCTGHGSASDRNDLRTQLETLLLSVPLELAAHQPTKQPCAALAHPNASARLHYTR